jgi:GMP synthase-like glutamine amidotransferase
MAELPDPVRLYGSHSEHVTQPPEGAEVLTRSEGCPIAGFAIGSHVYTMQHHPEMTPGFIAALTDELAGAMGRNGRSRHAGRWRKVPTWKRLPKAWRGSSSR